ncbi:hypothetical protein HYALB_00007706 [Hymenoscyphus albidus]|uniref:Uncharacterized protein n=1 Tax=Hymenoscyphus albidus TaxID=595503 RepID=A0A9N9Q4Y1_9HELO|nr:hypothetical protein HYALB_00007706 [Hymenoscyphus albidus]
MSVTQDLNPIAQKVLEIPMKFTNRGPILQLVFHSDSSQLLVYMTGTICIISLLSLSVTHSCEWPNPECKWVTHPQDTNLVLGVGPDALYMSDWTLTRHKKYAFEYPIIEETQRFAQVSLLSRTLNENMYMFFEISSIPTAFEDPRNKISVSFLPKRISSQISVTLSFTSSDRLVFLSEDSSTCSLKLPGQFLTKPNVEPKNKVVEEEIKTLFSLPGDWISRVNLELCCILYMERSLLCPRNGEVAIVRCAALR